MKSLQATNASAASAVAQAATPIKSASADHSSRQLPKTASSLPLIGLFGLASLALGLVTHALRKRVL
jgi:LPXTG-motif cell wall-anchored protein